MQKLLGIELTNEEFDFLMEEQIKGKELFVENGKVVAREHITTEEELTQQELQECLKYLRDTDYIANKLAEAESEFIETGDNTEIIALRRHYSNELTNRKIKRKRIRELEKLLSDDNHLS